LDILVSVDLPFLKMTMCEHANEHPVDGHHVDEHHSIARVTWGVFIALCVLTCASLMTYTDFWQQRVPAQVGRMVMMIVSVTKAFLVATFFMHLWWETNWKYVVTIPALCVSVLLCVALIPDIGKRTEQYDNARWLNAAEPMPYPVGGDLTVEVPIASETASHAAH
jgi:cytochrome c oxidase subunit IV